jgi:hypothetical protein
MVDFEGEEQNKSWSDGGSILEERAAHSSAGHLANVIMLARDIRARNKVIRAATSTSSGVYMRKLEDVFKTLYISVEILSV